ncbi:hypothetical protein [Streptomyces nigra]|uniref:hypothetical protein n=1 Tax=Streptomyces nigra TaxID=1827580 RepID=UPI0030D1B897
MTEVIDHRERQRKARDFLAGRCSCSTCEGHAVTYFPADYAAWCEERGRAVPAAVAELLAAPPDEVDLRPHWAVMGVDLGKRTDHSAVALLVPDSESRWRFPSVTRLPLASSAGAGGHYSGQAKRLAAAASRVLATVGPVLVVVDATGIGDAVVEMIGAELPDDRRVGLVSVVITGGRSAKHEATRWTVAKTALIDPMVAALEQGEVTFGAFNDAHVVRRELLAYRVKAASVEAGADRLEAERQSDHDDTVIACSLAVYAARRNQPMRVRAPLRNVPRSRASGLYRRRIT